MSVNSEMTAIANAVRDLRGMSGTMGLDAMATNINGAKTAVDAALAALAEKGVTVPAGTKVDGLAALIAAIEAGGGGLSLPPTITHFAVDTYTTTKYGVSYITCGHSLGVKPTAAIAFSAIPRVVEDSGKSYLEACFAFGSGCIFLNPGATGNFDGTVSYENLDKPSAYKRNSSTEMTETSVKFSANSKFYSQSFLVITMRWE